MIAKTLKWPVISLLITGGFHFLVEALLPALKDFFVAPVLGPILLAYGVWVGYRSVQNGGNLLQAAVGAVILGVMPLVLDTAGFGMILGRGTAWGFTAGVFALSMVLFGALLGSGFAMSKSEARI